MKVRTADLYWGGGGFLVAGSTALEADTGLKQTFFGVLSLVMLGGFVVTAVQFAGRRRSGDSR